MFFRICNKYCDILLLRKFKKECFVDILRYFLATKWKFGIVLSFQNMTNTNYTHARSPQQLSFSMHSANDVCRLGSFRFLFKSHLDIIIKLAIYSGKLNRKRKKSFSWIAVFYLSRILHSNRLTIYQIIYLRVNW